VFNFQTQSAEGQLREQSIMLLRTTTIKTLTKFVLAVLLLPGSGFSSSNVSEEALAKVRSLIGQPCTITNQDGSQAKGTLWGFDGTYIILKVVRDTSLYAKAEKYKLGQILFLEDEFGTRLDVPHFMAEEADTESKRLNALASEGRPVPDSSGSTAGSTIQYLPSSPNRITVDSASSGAVDDTTGVPSTAPPVRQPPGPGHDLRGVPARPQWVIPAPVKPTVRKPEIKKRALPKRRHRKMLYAARPQKQDVVVDTRMKAATPAAPSAVLPSFDKTTPVQAAGLAATERECTLQYQTAILFSVVAFLGILLVVARLKGLGTQSSLQNALAMPARVVRISGPYSIIDMGLGDGIQEAEVIHFFHKHAGDIAYCAKGRVLKVKQNYSAVEITERSSKWPLFVRDAAFRDCVIHPAADKSLRTVWRNLIAFFGSKNESVADGQIISAESAPPITVVSAEEEGKLMRAGIARL